MADLLSRRTKINSNGLFMLVMAPAKTGKSYFMGTQPEGNILHLHGAGESHGSLSASMSAGDRCISVQWITGDGLIKDFKELLTKETIEKNNIKCIALDSLTELFRDIKETKTFKQKCMTGKGTHNSFKESEAMVDSLSKIITWLRNLYNECGVNVICSMHAQITKSEDGNPTEIKPNLPGYGVAEFLVGQFNDLLVMTRNPKTNVPQFTTSTMAKRSSKNEDGIVTRYLDFTPCLQGAAELPEVIEASIPALLSLKKG